MTAIVFDSSAIMRRYDELEVGAWMVLAACQPDQGNELFIARHTTVEVASAIGRKFRTGELGHRGRSRMWRMLNGHVEFEYRMVDLNNSMFVEAERIVFAHPLRGFDALHISCALQVADTVPETTVQFWTADRRQAAAAAAEGLTVTVVE